MASRRIAALLILLAAPSAHAAPPHRPPGKPAAAPKSATPQPPEAMVAEARRLATEASLKYGADAAARHSRLARALSLYEKAYGPDDVRLIEPLKDLAGA